MDDKATDHGGDVRTGIVTASGQMVQPALLDTIHDLMVESEKRARKLKAEADAAAHTQTVWQTLHRYLSAGWPMHVASLLRNESAWLRQMQDQGHAPGGLVEELSRAADAESERILRRYPHLMELVCSQTGLPLDRASRHPKYTFDNGFFQLEIDEQRRSARLSDYEGLLQEMPADPGAIAEAVQREHKRVFERPFDARRTLKTIRQQYLAILKKENQVDGASIPIRHITRRLGKNCKGFRADEFLVDLSRLVAEGAQEIDGHWLDLQHTKDTSQGMLLYGAAGRGYVGFVAFRKGRQGE